jgi:hypothetical protein
MSKQQTQKGITDENIHAVELQRKSKNITIKAILSINSVDSLGAWPFESRISRKLKRNGQEGYWLDSE